MSAMLVQPRILHAYTRHQLLRLRCMSTAAGVNWTNTFCVGQGGRLSLHMPTSAAVVKVTTKWIDSCQVTISRLPTALADQSGDKAGTSESKKLGVEYPVQHGFPLMVNQTVDEVSIVHDRQGAREDWDAAYFVMAVVPELFSVDVIAARGSVTVVNKLKGDCEIQLTTGDIDVGVIRGEHITLSTGCGHVTADELEGSVDIIGTDVHARLINGAKVLIDSTGDDSSVTVGGLYSSGADISAAGNIAIAACHGRVAVRTAGAKGDVTLSSVNGSVQASTGGGDVRVHADALEEGTRNQIRSETGNVMISMSQETSVDMDIEGNIASLPAAFAGKMGVEQAVGTVVGAGMRPSQDPRDSQRDEGGGKIDLAAARKQSLRSYFSNDEARSVLPKLSVLATRGKVDVEILSWADIITRNFCNGAPDGGTH